MAADIGRRQFVSAFGGAVVAWPRAARAQQPKVPVVGFLGVSSLEKMGGGVLLDFKRGLAETGYVEDRNVAIEYRWAEEHYDRLPALATELVRRRSPSSLRLAARRRCRPNRRRLSLRSSL